MTHLTRSHGRVVVAGVALPDYAHRRAIVLGDDQRVGRGTVRDDGTFVGRGRMPRGRLWHRVLYRVKVGRVSTHEASLRRELELVARGGGGAGGVRAAIRLRRPAARRVVVQRLAGCRARRWTRVTLVRTDNRGRAAVTLPRPAAGARPALYRVRDARDRSAVSLPIAVDPAG
jgi:hypothetical protein